MPRTGIARHWLHILQAALLLFSFCFIAGASRAQGIDLPAEVEIPMDRPIRVRLETPLSTVNSKPGDLVTFHTIYSILLGGSLEVPPGTEILGHLVDVKKPGSFGKDGLLSLAVDRMNLRPGGGTGLMAHLDSAAIKSQNQTSNNKHRSRDTYTVLLETAGSAGLGSAIGGVKGAGVGAGAGAAAAVLILMSHHGENVYLEEGMHLSIKLDEPAYLSGADVTAAQEYFKKLPRPASVEPDSQDGTPKLKRRGPPIN